MTERHQYTVHETTPAALAKMRSHEVPYDAMVLGQPIVVLPDVWSPAYDWSSTFYVENMPDVRGLTFLEIGCGTGVISAFAGRAGAAKIVAVDVNENAVKNARLNLDRFGVQNAECVVSDGFSNVSGSFDVITWNAPYHGSKPGDMLERGCADENYEGIRAFFRDVGAYLNRKGLIVFGFSESGDLPLIRDLIANAGFSIRDELSDWREGYNCMLFMLKRAGESIAKA